MDERLDLEGNSKIVVQCRADSSAVTLYTNLFLVQPTESIFALLCCALIVSERSVTLFPR